MEVRVSGLLITYNEVERLLTVPLASSSTEYFMYASRLVGRRRQDKTSRRMVVTVISIIATWPRSQMVGYKITA